MQGANDPPAEEEHLKHKIKKVSHFLWNPMFLELERCLDTGL